MVFGKLPSRRWHTPPVEDFLNLIKHVIYVCRSFDISLSLALDYDISDFANFNRKRVIRALDLFDPGISFLGDVVQLAC
ncbi:hypothetical protein BMW24_008965 [Mycobacterium heckeshornense]|uniref:Uncharacterized protein n=1 Tax=Mycobacterium heckeshornense TaxID=110505 RepID=A0A2G8BBU9_9MYCO|nr:hypothetical protein ACT16_21990 [Mycobacterium heckeshornense]PIJ35233.1 hypothetical protein BMW24_008965 [Mycobacterium heckeshornense]BCO38092.1 hypothetical protein MHEC_45250 [Mycobacterium heckeshornense]